MKYKAALNKHLAEYKKTHLGIEEPGVFLYRGRDIKYPHILPLKHASANLFAEAASRVPNNIRRHRYFHHLNSSQAFAFNLFFPCFDGDRQAASTLLSALGQTGELHNWKAEEVPVQEEGSNIDVVWETTDGVRTYCEVKLSEEDFGKARVDARHQAKLNQIYRPQLAPHLTAECLEPATFFSAYQFYRNLWQMVRTPLSRLIFLLPRANTSIWQRLPDLLNAVAPQTRQRVSVIAIEDVLERLAADPQAPAWLVQYAVKLQQKYVI